MLCLQRWQAILRHSDAKRPEADPVKWRMTQRSEPSSAERVSGARSTTAEAASGTGRIVCSCNKSGEAQKARALICRLAARRVPTHAGVMLVARYPLALDRRMKAWRLQSIVPTPSAKASGLVLLQLSSKPDEWRPCHVGSSRYWVVTLLSRGL